MRSGISFFSYAPQRYSKFLLLLTILMVYVPFLGDRMSRTAGDDKVYVSQAVEMARNGHWFLQSLANEPNYFKGPLHYILLRVGMIFFGDSMWATVYMNLFFVILGALSLGAIVSRRVDNDIGWAYWVGSAFALSVGIYSHVFASQMEVETAGLFAYGLYLLDRSGPGKPDLKFWLVAGLVGWLKSPLHSALLGCTALLFWASQNELLHRIKSLKAYPPVLAGVFLCVLGYLPALILDNENFINAYVLRETLHKPANGAPWHYPIIPLFTYSLFPWVLPAIVAYIDGLWRLTQRFARGSSHRSSEGIQRVIWLGCSLVLPSVLFFLWHPYRGQNYNLPVVGGLILVVAALWSTRNEKWRGFYSLSMALTALIVIAIPLALTFVTSRYEPMPFWWPPYLLAFLWLGFFLTARGFWKEGFVFQQTRPAKMARRSIWMFIALGALLSTIGQREMVDIRHRLKTGIFENEKLHVSYYNLQKDIWSEWGYLNFQIPYPVSGLFTEADLFRAVENNDLILVPGDAWLAEMKEKVGKKYPKARWEINNWRRWMTKGKNSEGIPMWKVSWNEKDLSKLEKFFYMVRVFPGETP